MPPTATPIAQAISPTAQVKQAAEEKAKADRAAVAGTQRKMDEEVFARLSGSEPKKDAKEEPKEDGEETPSPKPKASKTKEAAPEETTDADPEGDDGEEEVGETAYNKAATLLNRFNVTAEMIAGMPKKNVIALAKTLQGRQAERDDIFRQLQESKKETAAPKSESTARREGNAGKDAPDEEVDGLIAPFLTDAYGDDVKESMRTFGKNVVAHYAKREAALREEIALAHDMAGEVLLDAVCAKLTGRYPELETEAGIAKARAKMFTLLKTGDYDTIDGVRARLASAMDDSVKNIWGKRREKKAEAAEAADDNALRQGGMHVPGQRGSPKALGPEEADMAAFMALGRGGSVRDARIAMSGSR